MYACAVAAATPHLDAALVDVRVVSRPSSLRLAEDDHLLEEEDVPYALLASSPHGERVLPQQHALLLQVDLRHDYNRN